MPKRENLLRLANFLRRYFPEDPLLRCVKSLYHSIQNTENWYEEELIFLHKLGEIVDSQFKSAITKILFAFNPQEMNFVNILVTIQQKEKSADFKRKYLVDGLVRRVCSYRTPAVDRVFPYEAFVDEEFDFVARRAQEYLIETGRVPEGKQVIRYEFMDDLAYSPELQHEGRSAGLAFAYLASSYHNSLDNRLAPYITWCGSLTGGNKVKPVGNIGAKIRTAKKNGIRIVVLSKYNREKVGMIEGMEFITYQQDNLGAVLDYVQSEIVGIHADLLGPKETEYWQELIEKSQRQTIPILNRAKRGIKYDPDKYINRSEIESDFESFLKESNKNCMAIVGNSGTGKTYLLCNLCDRSIENGNIVLFFDPMAFNSHSAIEDAISALKPESLKVESERFIGIVNDVAQWKGKYFMISLDGINEVDIGARKALSTIEDILVKLQRIPSERVRIFITCRNEMWTKILASRGFNLSEDRYYASSNRNNYVPLELFTSDECKEAIEVYFGEQARDLSDSSREMLRDPFMLRLTKEVYENSPLPSDILSWDLVENYYRKFIPDLLGDERRTLVETLSKEMLRQNTDKIPENDPGNTELRNLVKSKAFEELVDDAVILRKEGHIKYPHDRFTEMHIAKLIDQRRNEYLSKDFVVTCLHKARDFPHLWGALKLVLTTQWNTELILDLVRIGNNSINEFVVSVLIASGREDWKRVSEFLNVISQQGLTGVNRLILDIAYHLQDMDLLKKGTYDPDDEISATAVQYIYFVSRDKLSDSMKVLEDICQDISLPKMLRWKGRKSMQTAMALFLLIMADNFKDKHTRENIAETARGMLERFLGGKKRKVMKSALSTAINFINRLVNFTKQNEMDPAFNLKELSHFFSYSKAEREVLLDLLPYFQCQRTDLHAVEELIVNTCKRRDAISNVYIMNLFGTQATVEGQWKKIIPILRKIYDEGTDYNRCVMIPWMACSVLGSMKAVESEDIYEVADIHKEFVKMSIKDTRGTFNSDIAEYTYPVLCDFYLRRMQILDNREIEFMDQCVDQAIQLRYEDEEFLKWVLSNLAEISIIDSFRVVRQSLNKIITQADNLPMDSVVKTLTTIKTHYPEEVEDFIGILKSDSARDFHIEVKSSSGKSVEALSRQMTWACGDLVGYFIHNPDMRQHYTEAWARAAKCKSLGQWIQQIFSMFVNIVMEKEIFKEITLE